MSRFFEIKLGFMVNFWIISGNQVSVCRLLVGVLWAFFGLFQKGQNVQIFSLLLRFLLRPFAPGGEQSPSQPFYSVSSTIVHSIVTDNVTDQGASSLNFIRLLRFVITPSVTSLLRGENDSLGGELSALFRPKSLETAEQMARTLTGNATLELPRAAKCCEIVRSGQKVVNCHRCQVFLVLIICSLFNLYYFGHLRFAQYSEINGCTWW